MNKHFFALFAVFTSALTTFAADTIRIAHMPATGHSKLFVGKDTGIFEKYGLDIQLVEFSNTADGSAALRAGKVDGCTLGTFAPLILISQGVDLRLIAGIMGEDVAVIAKPENASKYQKIKDFKGKTIAKIRLSGSDAVLSVALRRNGLDSKKDVTILELKNPPAVIEAVKAGQVDLGLVWGPHDLRAEQAGLKVIFRSRDLAPGHVCCRFAVRAEALAQNRAAYVRLVKAFLEIERYIYEHQDETVAIVSKWIKVSPEIVRPALYNGFLDLTSDPNRVGIHDFWDVIHQAGYSKSDKDIDDFIDTAIYRQALEELTAEHPQDAYYVLQRKLFEARD